MKQVSTFDGVGLNTDLFHHFRYFDLPMEVIVSLLESPSSVVCVNLPAWLAGCTKAEAAAMIRARTKRVRAILKILKFYWFDKV